MSINGFNPNMFTSTLASLQGANPVTSTQTTATPVNPVLSASSTMPSATMNASSPMQAISQLLGMLTSLLSQIMGGGLGGYSQPASDQYQTQASPYNTPAASNYSGSQDASGGDSLSSLAEMLQEMVAQIANGSGSSDGAQDSTSSYDAPAPAPAPAYDAPAPAPAPSYDNTPTPTPTPAPAPSYDAPTPAPAPAPSYDNSGYDTGSGQDVDNNAYAQNGSTVNNNNNNAGGDIKNVNTTIHDSGNTYNIHINVKPNHGKGHHKKAQQDQSNCQSSPAPAPAPSYDNTPTPTPAPAPSYDNTPAPAPAPSYDAPTPAPAPAPSYGNGDINNNTTNVNYGNGTINNNTTNVNGGYGDINNNDTNINYGNGDVNNNTTNINGYDQTPPAEDCPPPAPTPAPPPSYDDNNDSKYYGDPHFVGFGGEKYDVMGEAGKTYNILSDKNLQYNGKFVAWDANPGSTVIGEAGITSGKDQIDYKLGKAPKLNGKEMESGKDYTLDAKGKAKWDGSNLHFENSEYNIDLSKDPDNKDAILSNVKVKDGVNPLADGVAPNGLLGQTADGVAGEKIGKNADGTDKTKKNSDEKQGGTVIDGSYSDYEVKNLFDTSFQKNNQFNA